MYEAWRQRSPDNPRRIGGAKWDRELAASKLLFDWAVARGHVARSPVTMRTVRLRDGSKAEVAANKAKDVRALRILTGWAAQKGWRGRRDRRNAAFADLLFGSGLRLRESAGSDASSPGISSGCQAGASFWPPNTVT
jgi:site-specific recombinase XerC